MLAHWRKTKLCCDLSPSVTGSCYKKEKRKIKMKVLIIYSSLDVIRDVFCLNPDWSNVGRQKSVDLFAVTVIRSIHTNVGIAQIEFKSSMFLSQRNSCYSSYFAKLQFKLMKNPY